MDGIRVGVEYNNGESRICDEWDYEPKKAVLGQDLVVVTVGDASATLAITVAPGSFCPSVFAKCLTRPSIRNGWRHWMSLAPSWS
ncbi:hypothetical protein LAWASA_4154 [Lawsonibacter asaccharolyticus]|nr:hypothetical protein LAWASA_4154 [Lawsonibacter asaccharolyticus]